MKVFWLCVVIGSPAICLLLVSLRANGIISWPWWLVTAPVTLPVAIYLLFCVYWCYIIYKHGGSG